jgi:hypothetical protein
MKSYILVLIAMLVISGFVNIASAVKDSDDVNVKEEIVKTPEGKTLIKRTVSHPKDVKQKDVPARAPKETCYKYFARWSAPVSYYLNPSYNVELLMSDLVPAIDSASETWDTASGLTVSMNGATTLPYGALDGVNAVMFGDNVADIGVIAQTIIWYYPGYARRPGIIVEFDMSMEENFLWATDGNPTTMDVQNIATHEFGHAFGLSDLYTSACFQQTMYGYSWVGDITKRTLESGDIDGIRYLYP